MAEETMTVSTEAEKIEEPVAPSTSSAEPAECEDVEEEAKKLMGAGRRHMVMKDVRCAVDSFQQACSILGKKYGETADQCADAFFCYGTSLLELARMENDVLGNALEGMPEDEEEDGEKEEDPNIPSASNLDEKEREQLREQVYDAMAEKEEKKGEAESKTEGKEEDGTQENGDVDMEDATPEKKGEEKPSETDSEMVAEAKDEAEQKKSSDAEKGEEEPKAKPEEPKAKPEETSAQEPKAETEEKPKEEPQADTVSEEKSVEAPKAEEQPAEAATEGKNTEAPNTEASTEAVAEEKTTEDSKTQEEAEKKSAEDTEDSKLPAEKVSEEPSTDCKDDKPSTEGKADKAEGGEEEPEPMEGEEEQGAESEDGDENEGAEDNEGTEEKENEEEVGNLQLAWEMLDLSKVIFQRQKNKESQLKAAQAHLKLGEVSVESENYSQAVEDFLACLTIQKEHLEVHDRLLAETHYQLALAYQYSSKHDCAISHFTQSTEVIEKRLAVLIERVEKASGESTEELQKEMDELKGLLPDIREKIEDSKEAQKTAEATEKALKETLIGGTSGFSQENGSSSSAAAPAEKSGETIVPVTTTNCVSDISHLVRKKRKPEEESPVKEAKKPKSELVENGSGHGASENGSGHEASENGSGDAVAPTNEEGEKMEEDKPAAVETPAVESTA